MQVNARRSKVRQRREAGWLFEWLRRTGRRAGGREPDNLRPVGPVRFGLAGKGSWPVLDNIRHGPAERGGFVPVKPMLDATVKHFGRFRTSGAIRDGVLVGMPRVR